MKAFWHVKWWMISAINSIEYVLNINRFWTSCIFCTIFLHGSHYHPNSLQTPRLPSNSEADHNSSCRCNFLLSLLELLRFAWKKHLLFLVERSVSNILLLEDDIHIRSRWSVWALAKQEKNNKIPHAGAKMASWPLGKLLDPKLWHSE